MNRPAKRLVALLLAVILIFGCFTACGKTEPTTDIGANNTATPSPTEKNRGELPKGTFVPIPLNDGQTTESESTAASVPVEPPADPDEHSVDTLLPAVDSDFEDAKNYNDTKWRGINGNVILSIDEDGFVGKCLKFTKDGDKSASFHTALLDIAPYIKEPGIYTISFKIKLQGASGAGNAFAGVVRCDSETSFAGERNGQFYKGTGSSGPLEDDIWYLYNGQITVGADDIGKGGRWRLGLQSIEEGIETVWMDDIVVKATSFEAEAKPVTEAITWVANELVLISNKTYSNPFMDVNVDLVLTNGKETYNVPGFWDGGNIWRVRFVCTSVGDWTYTTTCSDTSNTGLHGQTGTVKCKAYMGNLSVYKHGFVKTQENTKYFVHADGTPFFYLGDTHWALGAEPIDMVKTIVKERATQGYTVFQSEPIGAGFDLVNGLDASDIQGFRSYDQKFREIANYGLVHTNASHFFTSSMQQFIENFGGFTGEVTGFGTKKQQVYTFYDISDEAKDMLERLCRYWVARYSAYPVMWTLAQECDNDFFWEQLADFHGHEKWGLTNNPYRYVAEYMGKYDPYNSPLTAHQEGSTYSHASNSAFREVEEHTWYASQWKPSKKGDSIIERALDYFEHGQGKPCVNYESHYCMLETKNFGARAQGWMSFLSGFCGYGYGAQGTWYYLGNYNADQAGDDGVDIVTTEQKKAATWQEALKLESSIQTTYMRNFFENTVVEWYNLIPRFEDTAYLEREIGAYGVIASNADNTDIVVYFYNFSDTALAEKPNALHSGTKTGTLKGLKAGETYNYLWFNPVTGKIDHTSTFTADSNGSWVIGEKATSDMVLYVFK